MSFRRTKSTPPPKSSSGEITESRDVRAIAVFFLVASVLLLFAGCGTLTSERGGARILGIMWVIAGLAGMFGWVAALRGGRRWSRLVYLTALAFPLGTFMALGSHGIRWGCINPGFIHSRRIEREGRPSHEFVVGFWAPRLRAVIWLAVAGVLVVGGFVASGDLQAARDALLFLSTCLVMLLWGMCPFAGWSCVVGDSGILTSAGDEIRWEEVSGVTRVPLPGFPFLWLHTRDLRPSIRIPLFLKDMNDFARAIRRHTPPDHPLQVVLAR